jgi:hypothetical protein
LKGDLNSASTNKKVMATITDEYMKEMMATTKPFTIAILKKGPKFGPDAMPIIWEHGRRNFSLKADGLLPVVCPVRDDVEMAGVGIFITDIEETKKILDGDPAIQAGVLVYEVYPTRTFPGSSLPQ